jgi:F0F1-type ATP synthase assembly protein I
VAVHNPHPANRNAQRDTVLSLVTAFVVALLLLQLWLLTGAIEGAMGGEGTILLPATFASGFCFIGAWRLWFMLQRRL